MHQRLRQRHLDRLGRSLQGNRPAGSFPIRGSHPAQGRTLRRSRRSPGRGRANHGSFPRRFRPLASARPSRARQGGLYSRRRAKPSPHPAELDFEFASPGDKQDGEPIGGATAFPPAAARGREARSRYAGLRPPRCAPLPRRTGYGAEGLVRGNQTEKGQSQ